MNAPTAPKAPTAAVSIVPVFLAALLAALISAQCTAAETREKQKKTPTRNHKVKNVEKATDEELIPPDVKLQEDYVKDEGGGETPVVPAYSIWRIVFGLGAVIALIFVFSYMLRFLWVRGMRLEVKGRHIRVLDTVQLGINRSLYLVQVGTKLVLVASTDKGMNFITEITDPGEVETILEEYKPGPLAPASFSNQLLRSLKQPAREAGKRTSSYVEKLKEKLSRLHEES
ncbi:MAG: flagellar biosynthetic protein FliO [bacterium]